MMKRLLSVLALTVSAWGLTGMGAAVADHGPPDPCPHGFSAIFTKGDDRNGNGVACQKGDVVIDDPAGNGPAPRRP